MFFENITRKIVMSILLTFLGTPTVGWAGPIHDAARKGEIEKVEHLLSTGTNINEKDKIGETPLHVAVNWNKHEMVKFLLEKGADPNTKNKNGITPLIQAILESSNLRNEDTSFESLKMILANRGNPNFTTEPEQLTPLHFTARDSTAAKAQLLMDHGGKVNIKDKKGWTPLHYAVNEGNAPVAKVLIENGANANESYENGETFLDRAADEGYGEIVTLLTESGAESRTAARKERRLPKILVRLHYEEQAAFDGSTLLQTLDEKQRVIENEAAPLASSLSLVQSCKINVKEDIKLIFKGPNGDLLYSSKKLNRDPKMFDFAINVSKFFDEHAKYFLSSPLKIDVREAWEISKTSTPSIKQSWELAYTLEARLMIKDIRKHAEEVAPKLLEEIVAPKRGPILKEICSFIKQHFNPNASITSE